MLQRKFTIIALMAALVCALLAIPSRASAQVCTTVQGSFLADTPTQNTRLFRDGVPSTCAAPKVGPGGGNFAGTYRYILHTFTNTTAAPSCRTYRLSQLNVGIFLVAYSNFDPNNVGATYRADSGSSSSIAEMSLTLAAGETIQVVVNEVNPGGAVGQNYTLLALPCNTSVSLASSLNPSVLGESVTLTAGVGGGIVTATGNMTFKDGNTSIATVALNGAGQAVTVVPNFTAGIHNLSAVYPGDPNTPAGTATLTQTVNNAATTTTLASSANPSTPGASVTFTANVAVVAPGTGTAAGTVTFTDGDTTLGNGTLDGAGQTTFTTTSLAGGAHPIKATYNGSISHGSSFASLTQTVNTAASNVAVTATPTSGPVGTSVVLDATVTAGAGGTPTGTVTYKEGATTLATKALSAAATSTHTVANLGAGAHTITVDYAGDVNHAPGSGSVNVTINKLPSTITVTSSVNPAIEGTAISFQALVTQLLGTSGGGTITVKNGTTTLGTVAVANGGASYTTTAIPPGTYSITAEFSGNDTYAGSTSAVLTQTVSPKPAGGSSSGNDTSTSSGGSSSGSTSSGSTSSGSTSSGGTSTSSGGTSTSSGGTSTSSGSSGTSEEGGCSVTQPGSSRLPGFGLLAVAAALLLSAKRRGARR